MSNHFVQLPPDYFKRAYAAQAEPWCAPYAIVTANERLAAEYRRCVEDALCQRFEAWLAPPIYSINSYLGSQLAELQQNSGRSISLVGPEQIKTALYAIDSSLPGLVLNHFSEAYDLIHSYDIDLGAPELADNPMPGWYRQVTAALPPNHAHVATLPDLLLAGQSVPPMPLWLVGFDVVSKPLGRYLKDLQRRNLLCHSVPEALHADEIPLARQAPSKAPLLSFDSLHEELAHAAAWAREIKLRKPRATIGIVVPYLNRHYDLVLRQIGLTLDPLEGSLSSSFDISGGSPLGRSAVWRAAHQVLQGVIEGLDHTTLQRLHSSLYLDLPGIAQTARKWPAQFSRRATLAQLWRGGAYLGALEGVHAGAPNRTLADWSVCFIDILEACCWPNVTDLGSNQFQCAGAITEHLNRWSNDSSTTPYTATQALHLIDELLLGILFAPQRASADIRVLGMLETTGLEFSHLWVCGMSADQFPVSGHGNPFIPPRIATRHGVPRSNPLQEWLFATRLLNHWHSCSGELCFSYCARDAEGTVLASPLVQSWCSGATDIGPACERGSLAQHPLIKTLTPAALNERIDDYGLPCDAGPVAGGTGLLKAQQECAFKGYAHYRLNLREPMAPYDLPNAAARGSLLHAVLQDLLAQYPGSEALKQVSEQQIQQLVQRALARSQALPRPFVQHEIERVTHLVKHWLETEHKRQPFENVQVEGEYRIDFAGLVLTVRIDRIDRIDDFLVVIDYKTGDVRSVPALKRAMEEPQLPIYSLVEDAVQGVYYARVRSDYCALLGLSAGGAEIQGARVSSTEQDWSSQRQEWHTRLDEIADEFRRGYAAVAPGGQACNFCNLRGFCRVGSQTETATDSVA